MSDQPAVIVKELSKSFKLPHERAGGIKNLLVNFYKRKKGYEQQHVLHGIDFEIKQGEFFGIVGRNGSGKSTLLKMLAGIYVPDEGAVQVNGSLTPFIELGVGFNPELTGRENVFLNGALLGFDRKQVAEMYEDIVEFAELGRFMDQKLKNYSSGMQVRLAFSIAIRADSDILLIDEVLAVGDAIFQQKCYEYFRELKERKKTVILVSHDSKVLEEYCDNGVLIENGRLVEQGSISRIVRDYTELLNQREEGVEDQMTASDADKERWGNGDIEVVEVITHSSQASKAKKVFADADTLIDIVVTYKAQQAIARPVYGITITDTAGERIFQSNTLWSDVKTTDVTPGEKIEVVWRVPNIFNTGSFKVSPAVADHDGKIIYDWREAMTGFKIRKKLVTTAHANVAHTITMIVPSKKSDDSV
jgi:ABC-2 type transport system ATP-binding protein